VQQVIGTAIAINILSRGYIEIWVAILVTASDVFVFLILERTGIRIVEVIFALFIGVMGSSFLYMYILAKPSQIAVLEGIAYPWCQNCTNREINQLVGIIGSIVLPHNVYFHSSLVLSRTFSRTEASIQEANKYYGIESAISLLISFVINLFLTSVSAKTFSHRVITNSTEPAPVLIDITLFNAGDFIQTHYGLTALIIWAVGLLSAGQCSTITGTYAGQFIMEGFTKINLSKWKRIIITRSISIVPCVIITLLAIDVIGSLSFWCNIIKAMQLPFALLPILHFTSSKRIMGTFRSNFMLRSTCYLITACVLSVNVYFVIMIIIEKKNVWSYVIGICLVVYLIFVTFFMLGVNNVYKVNLLLRRIFCSNNAEELDALLHANPIYNRPVRQQPRNIASIDKASPLTPSPLLVNHSLIGGGATEPFSNSLQVGTLKRKRTNFRNKKPTSINLYESPTII
jgi:natural resistance-associated macrophage protein